MKSRFVICDIEATGLHEEKEPIEIALITLEDDRVVEIYETLVNPLLPVSDFITSLTSISGRELESAPKFYEVAEAISMRLTDAVFVSHNTEFDLGLLKKKFSELGQELKLKSFCTLKHSQQEIPGLKSYTLDALCSFFGIRIRDRHRAVGDAMATLELFRELLNLKGKGPRSIRFLPHHEHCLKQLSKRPGLLRLRSSEGKLVDLVPAFDMLESARNLLEIKPKNRERLLTVESIEGEATGSALIALFRQLLQRPLKFHWCIREVQQMGLKGFAITPARKGVQGLWYFEQLHEAKQKLRALRRELEGESYAYREGGRSKEEILLRNRKVELLSREARFPSENLVILGEGRTLGERSLILVRNGSVVGFGYTEASVETILEGPQRYLVHRYNRNLNADLAARHHLRVLKNLRTKTECWRSLSVHAKLEAPATQERDHGSEKI